MYEKEIELKLQELSVDLRREVLDYIDFLIQKYKNRDITKKKFKFDWEGGLSEMRNEFTSVDLQHKSLEYL